MIWKKTTVNINGKLIDAIAPAIISASRATDIPAFYTSEFIQCLRRGYLYWKNPFNNKKSLVSFENTRFIVFWSKNPNPVIPYLDEIKSKGIDFYFNYTLNDYEKEKFENNLPSLKKRIETFAKLSEKIGKEKVIWRFDPVIITKNQEIESVVNKIENIAYQLKNHTEKMVFSFIETKYRKVQQKLKSKNIEIKKLDLEEKHLFAKKLMQNLNKYNLEVASCAESEDFSQFGIAHNKCIDNKLINRIITKNSPLYQFIDDLENRNQLKDKGQRKYCECMVSKDIGRYDTCGYSCIYCYAMRKNTPEISKDIFS